MKIIEFSFNVAVFCSLRNTRKKALEPKIFEALLGFPGQPPTLHLHASVIIKYIDYNHNSMVFAPINSKLVSLDSS
jgi:hypothetical protein